MIGQVVGTYRILSKLGAGGMGAVWLAEHSLLGRRVAIKFLHAEVSQNPAIVERFFAEARAATRISDPGIVVVYDFGWHTDGGAYIVMEHLAGESLAARLRGGRISLLDAVHVTKQAAMSMAVAHAGGIVHRDLKPDNIFLVPDPAMPGGERVKILDFGIAKLVGDDHSNPALTRTGTIMGTPTYMSPEQCRGASDVDHRTDIYALGGVLFHLMCGRPPFFASTAGDLIAAHLREMPQAPSELVPEIPFAIDAIVLRCLAKAAGDRYATMTELVRDLGAAMGSLSLVPTIAPLRAKPRQSSRERADSDADGTASDPRSPLSTFRSSAGEATASRPHRGRHLGIALGAFAAVAAVVAIAFAVRSSKPASPAGPPEIRSNAPVDAAPRDADGTVTFDAAPIDAAPADAPPIDAPRKRVRPAFDPFENR